MVRNDIRLALPSKGILNKGALEFLDACGLSVYRPNPRQYEAVVPALDNLTVMFQRPGDIVVSVQQGSVDFGITGLDVFAERSAEINGSNLLLIHDRLGFGPCRLELAVPDRSPIFNLKDLTAWAEELAKSGKALRVATKFPNVVGSFLNKNGINKFKIISVEGTLEIAPAIGYADIIADLVSSGTTLRDNHLRQIEEGTMLYSEASLIANRKRLQEREDVLQTARKLLEYIEAHMRAKESVLVTANMRGESPQAISDAMFEMSTIGGLQGPTISQVVIPQPLQTETKWFAVNIVVQKDNLFEAISELRQIGGSGVVVTPCKYIFEEEPARYQALLQSLA